MIAGDDFDYWTQQPAPQEKPAGPPLIIEPLDTIVPLASQFGADETPAEPDALGAVLFGQPAPTEAELAKSGAGPENLPPLHTYAILDAAKVVNLPEMLEASGLEHRCLFKDDAYDALKDAAPWIVRLEDGNTFTRNLFTRSGAPWHLWDTEPGIYVRSRGTLDEMWAHFRKFTKIRDENSKWYYCRFFDPATAFSLLDQTVFWQHCLNCSLVRNGLILTGRMSVRISCTAQATEANQLDFALLRRRDIRRQTDQMARTIQSTFDLGRVPPVQTEDQVYDAVQRMMACGVRNTGHLQTLAAWDVIYGQNFETRDPDGRLGEILRSDVPALKKFKRFKARMSELPFQSNVGKKA